MAGKRYSPVPSCPFGAGILPISPECVHAAVTGLSDYGRCAFGSGHALDGAGRFFHCVLRGNYIASLAGVAGFPSPLVGEGARRAEEG
jgi:hypothetical protein